jgi:hypothetical protein
VHTFRPYIDQLPRLRDLCGSVCRYSATQGVVVEPSLLWQIAWALKKDGWPAEAIRHFLTYIGPAWQSQDGARVRQDLDHEQVKYPFDADPEYDYEWYPEELRKYLGTQFPVTVHVHLCIRNLPQNQFDSERRDIEGIAQQFRNYFEVLIEERPLARLAASPGGYVKAASSGTLGGYVVDGSNRVYGMTCAHVAPAGSSVLDGRGLNLGNILHASSLTPSHANQLCNLHSPLHNEIDAAMYVASIGTLPSGSLPLPPQFGSGQFASMTGQKSGGPHVYRTDGIAIIERISHNGMDFCFRNLFVIKNQLTGWLAMPLQIALAPIPTQGDSGAWIHTNPSVGQPGWIGMLTGTDMIDGFAIEAAGILSWASALTGTNLSVY